MKALGDQVEVTGFMAVSVKCRGKVLKAEEVRAISNWNEPQRPGRGWRRNEEEPALRRQAGK